MAFPRGNRRRRAAVEIVGVMLIVVIAVSAALAVWLVTSNLSSMGKSQAEKEVEAAKKRISTSVAIESVKANVIYLRNVGKDRINSAAIYFDGKPVDPIGGFQGLASKETAAVRLPLSVTYGVHTVRVVANGLSQDTVKVAGKDMSVFKWKRPLSVASQARDYVNVWAFGGAGMNLTFTKQIPAESVVVLDADGFEIPSRVSSNWFNRAWAGRKAFALKDESGQGYSGEPVEVTLDSLQLLTGRCSEIRVTDQLGNAVPMQVLQTSGSSCTILMQATVGANSSSTYYVYYTNPDATEGIYDTSLSVGTEGDGSALCLKNGIVSVCLGLVRGGITNLSYFGKENLLAQSVGSQGAYSGITPSVNYKEGWDYSACTSYAYKNHKILEDGPVRKRVEYVFSTTCGAKEYGYKYLISLYAGAPYYDLELSNLNTIDFGGKFQNFLVQSNWAEVWPSKDSVVVDGKYSAYWDSSKPSASGVGVGAFYFSPRAIPGFIRPSNFIVLDDSKSLDPSVISRTRTFLFPNSAGSGAVVAGYARMGNGTIQVTQGAKELPPQRTEMKLDFITSVAKGASRTVYVYYTDVFSGQLRSPAELSIGRTDALLPGTLGDEVPAS